MPEQHTDPPANLVRNYVGRDFALVRVHHKSKRPIGLQWQKSPITTEHSAIEAFRGPVNIGVLLGSASKGLIDVDIDSPEAQKFADTLLPWTKSIFGRKSKPRSHRLYRVKGTAPTEKFVDPITGTTLLELRGDKADGTSGFQTVLPGSIHESGEPIEWEEDDFPTVIGYEELSKSVTRLAMRALIERYCPGITDPAQDVR